MTVDSATTRETNKQALRRAMAGIAALDTEAVQAELSRFVESLGIDAEQTGQTYDVLVRGMLASA